jgi:hypothetical protein
VATWFAARGLTDIDVDELARDLLTQAGIQ